MRPPPAPPDGVPDRGPDRAHDLVTTLGRSVAVLGLLYAFLVGVSLLEGGIAALGEGFETGLLREVSHPVAGLFAGLLLTVLVQSSSVSTSTIVGLVGAGTLSLPLAVPMIMGANIGTTITNTLVALGSIRRPEEFRRGFAGATIHDFFNIIAVALLLPLELSLGVLSRTAAAVTRLLTDRTFGYEPGTSPIRAAVRAPATAFADALATTPLEGVALGVVGIAVAIGVIFGALTSITRLMRALIAGSVERAMNRVVARGGGVAGIVLGMAVTMAVQSSSITTSILVPLVASGVLTVRNAFPVTLGANIGTTITALIASLAVARPEGLTIALVHTLFNVFGIALIYPIRRIRDVPVRLAQALATAAVRRRSIVVAYVAGVFLVIPVVVIVASA